MVQTVATVLVSLICLCLGQHLRHEANKVLHGGEPKDPISFKALSRYPGGDYGKHWEKKDNPEMVRLLGIFLVLAGSLGIIQTLWPFRHIASAFLAGQ